MAVNTNQTKYFSNIGVGADQLRFSQIASTMGLDGTSNIRWGDYKRKTGANETFADVDGTPDEKNAATGIVPDAYENRTCGVDGQGVSTGLNHKVSSLKNMIKRYDVGYTGGSTSERTIHAGGNVISNTTTWDENLDLNIPKRLTFGSDTWGASTTSEHAVKFSGAALNLELKFNGTKIKGKEGAGGSVGTNGGAAGSALYLRNNTTRTNGNAKTIKLDVSNNSLIAGGGGGGGGGSSGNVSGNTICEVDTTVNGSDNDWRRSCPSPCPCNGAQARFFRGRGGYRQGTIYYTDWRWTCPGTEEENGNNPAARTGGPGGAGAGSNRANAAQGSGGQSAATGNCANANATIVNVRTANAGYAGGAGGGLGVAGQAGNGGNGGAKGRWLNASTTPWQHIGSSSNTILKGGTQ